MYNRFDRIPGCDRQTDRDLETARQKLADKPFQQDEYTRQQFLTLSSELGQRTHSRYTHHTSLASTIRHPMTSSETPHRACEASIDHTSPND